LKKKIKIIIKTGSGYGPEYLPVLREAKNILKRINRGRPTAENYFQLGSLCIKLEDSQLALDAFLAGYYLNKNHVNCGTYAALLLEQQQRWKDAISLYTELNNLDPGNSAIVDRILSILYKLNDIKQALTICQEFLKKNLNYPAIYEYLALFYFDSGNVEKSIEYLKSALVLDPDNENYKNRLIHHLVKNKDFEEVLKFDQYVNSSDEILLEVKLLYAQALAGSGDFKSARNYYVYLLKSYKDKFVTLAEIAHYYMSFGLNPVKGRFINSYILKRQPDNVAALTNLAIHSGHDFSIPAYEKVLKLCPDEPMFRMNYGHQLLATGKFVKGFEFYESRVSLSQPYLTGRLTNPSTINGKKLFIWREQGIGDQMMWGWFFRYLVKNNISATIHIEPRLLNLMKNSFPSFKFLAEEPIDICLNENLQEYDAEILTFSLGKYLIPEIIEAQNQFEEGNYQGPHLLADGDKISYWNKLLKDRTANKTVGVCWRSGTVGNLRDYSYLSAENIVEIFKNLSCSVVNLQYDYEDEEIELIKSALGERFINFSEINLKDDQDDLAALMTNLDLVFSVGTAVMALAGSIGVSTLCPGWIGTLGKPFNVMIPSVKSIASHIPMREDTEHQILEIKAALNI